MRLAKGALGANPISNFKSQMSIMLLPSLLIVSPAMRADWSLTARSFFTRPPRRFKTRLSQGSTALQMPPSKFARCRFSHTRGWITACVLREWQGPIAAVASGRWRDALFEGPFGRSPERTKLAEPSSDRAMRFHLAEASGYTATPSRLWCARPFPTRLDLTAERRLFSDAAHLGV